MYQPHRSLHIAGLFAVVLAVVAATPAAAQDLDSILDLYKNAAQTWEPTLRNYAMGLFASLVAIEVAFTFIMLALRQADMGEFLTELTKRILFVGFFSFLLMNSGWIAESIIESFRMAGNAAAQAGGGSGGVRPSDIFEVGMTLATRIAETKVGWGIEKIAEGLTLMVCGLLLAICFALMTAFLILALVESYIVTSAAILLLGFGGSRWTSDLAVKTLMYTVAVGAKLFVIQILVGISERMVLSWVDTMGPATAADGYGEIILMLGATLVMVALVKTIPDTVQGIISGASPGNGGALPAAAMMAAGGAAAAGVSMAGAGSAVAGAGRLASEQLKTAEAAGQGPSTSLGKAAAFAAATVGNLGKAASQDLGNKLGGRAPFGTAGGRMGADMSHQAEQMKAKREKPDEPSAAVGGEAAAAAGEGGGDAGAGGGADGGSAGGAGAGAGAGAGGGGGAEAAPAGGEAGASMGEADNTIKPAAGGAASAPQPELSMAAPSSAAAAAGEGPQASAPSAPSSARADDNDAGAATAAPASASAAQEQSTTANASGDGPSEPAPATSARQAEAAQDNDDAPTQPRNTLGSRLGGGASQRRPSSARNNSSDQDD